jgi:CPA2 family monovalent cation:H+ antiporter-2
MGFELGILPAQGRDLILAGALISIILNPLAFAAAERLLPRLEKRRAPAPAVSPGAPVSTEAAAAGEAASPALTGHIVLVGYGRVGMAIAESLSGDGTAVIVIEAASDRVAVARKAGHIVIEANAAAGEGLVEARIETAKTLFVAIPNAFEAGQVVEGARRLNAKLLIIARAHSDEEAEYLRQLGADHVVMGEREIGIGMAQLGK